LVQWGIWKSQRRMTPGYSWPHPQRRVVRLSDTPERAIKDKKGNVLLIYRGYSPQVRRSLTSERYAPAQLRVLRTVKGVGRPLGTGTSAMALAVV
jgi:hypothetical protein